MEEDPCNLQPDKNKKRKLKTPAQVEALERFYGDHKYPTEQMKAQLAESLGLMEKQVSGWFCHRRLKDKRSLVGETCDNVRPDRLSGVVIQDRASGHSQYSCGGSKEDDNNHFDLKEVESKRSIDGHKEEEETDTDDTSSEDSIPLQRRYLPRSYQQPYMNVANSKYPVKMSSRNIVPADSKHVVVKTPSGYLKVKVPKLMVENPAITAVKRQLGRHYHEDGPLLGVEFDPLPPDAFDSPTPDHHLMYKTEFIGTNEHFESGMKHETYNCQTNSQNLDFDGTRSKFICDSDPQEYYSNSLYPKDPPRSIRPIPDKYSSELMHEDFSGDMSPYEHRKPYGIMAKHSSPRNYSRSHNQRTCEETESPFCKSYEQSTESSQAKYLLTHPMEGVSHNTEDRKAARRIYKVQESNFSRGRNTKHGDYYNSAFATQPPREQKVMKRVLDEPPEYHHTRKAPAVEMPVWTNHLKSDFTRSGLDHVPSSSSDDETDETATSPSSED